MEAPEVCGDVRKLGVESWLVELRKDLAMAEQRGGERFEGLRSEEVFSRVLAKLEQDRLERRRAWLPRIARGVRSLTALAATLWNSRALRILMP